MWNLFKSIFFPSPVKGKAKAQPGKKSFDDTYLSASGRVKLQEIRTYAKSVPAATFYSHVTFAVLVGSSIHSGAVTPNPNAGPPPEGRKKTLLFKANIVAQLVEGASLEASIFPIKHGPTSRNTANSQLSIGRGDDNDIVMNDVAVSQRHAIISISRHGYAIADAGSTNGTKVNGTKVFKAQHPLKDGDTVTFGRYNFTFHTPPGFYAFLTNKKK
jgi:hypothetical protein